MTSALKMIAEMIAERGRAQRHDVELVERPGRALRRVGGGEHRGQDREVLRDVVGDRERGQRAARDQQLLADLDDLDQLRRVGVEVDHVARLARRLGAGVHRHADVGLRERRARRWCRRRSSRRGGRRPAGCGSGRACASGVASARKSSTPASSAILAAVRRLSPVTITVRMPIARSCSKRSRMPSLIDVAQLDHAEHLGVARDRQRRRALARDAGRPRAAARAAPGRPRRRPSAGSRRPRPCAGACRRSRRRSCASAR